MCLSNQMNQEAKEILKMQEELVSEREQLAAMRKEAQEVKSERVKELEKLHNLHFSVALLLRNLYSFLAAHLQHLSSNLTVYYDRIVP